MSYEFFTVNGECENILVIERSKFICNIKGIENEEQAKEFIELIRKRHSLANHCCYAYIADDKGLIQKFSDAGEPQGTAGLPMLEVLKNKRIFKTVVVVTRYFGGIKLGTGGLTRAYGGSVSECLTNAKIGKMIMSNLIHVAPDYEGYSRLLKVLSDENVSIVSTEFENVVNVKIAVKSDYIDSFKNKMLDAFNGKIEITDLGCSYYDFGWDMPVITSVLIQKNNKNRCNVFVDNQFYCAINVETVVKNQLKSGVEIDKESLDNLIFESQKQEALTKAADYISKNLKTKKEVKDYLVKKGYTEQVAWYCVDKLKEYDYIDDKHYSKCYIESVSKRQGRRLTEYKLMMKGVKKEEIESAYLETEVNDKENAKLVAEKYLKNKEITKENLSKAYRYLIGKGFSYDEATFAIKEFNEG